jgi:hypothetical protein
MVVVVRADDDDDDFFIAFTHAQLTKLARGMTTLE